MRALHTCPQKSTSATDKSTCTIKVPYQLYFHSKFKRFPVRMATFDLQQDYSSVFSRFNKSREVRWVSTTRLVTSGSLGGVEPTLSWWRQPKKLDRWIESDYYANILAIDNILATHSTTLQYERFSPFLSRWIYRWLKLEKKFYRPDVLGRPAFATRNRTWTCSAQKFYAIIVKAWRIVLTGAHSRKEPHLQF